MMMPHIRKIRFVLAHHTGGCLIPLPSLSSFSSRHGDKRCDHKWLAKERRGWVLRRKEREIKGKGGSEPTLCKDLAECGSDTNDEFESFYLVNLVGVVHAIGGEMVLVGDTTLNHKLG